MQADPFVMLVSRELWSSDLGSEYRLASMASGAPVTACERMYSIPLIPLFLHLIAQMWRRSRVLETFGDFS
jgi:hypothetical protein